MYKRKIDKLLADKKTPAWKYDFKRELPGYSEAEEKRRDKDEILFLLYCRIKIKHEADRCPLADEVYRRLKFGEYGIKSQLNKSDIYPRWNGDTMNSFFTVFNKAFRLCCSTLFGDYSQDKKSDWLDPKKLVSNEKWVETFRKCANGSKIYDSLNMYAKLSHTIGNFISVPTCGFDFKDGKNPTSFNRGRYSRFDDFWDLSLRQIQITEPSMFEAFSKECFLNDIYINNGKIDALIPTHEKLLEKPEPMLSLTHEESKMILTRNDKINMCDLYNYLENINSRIKKRGEVMVKKLDEELKKIIHP